MSHLEEERGDPGHCEQSLALRWDNPRSPAGVSPSMSPPQELGFWLARGTLWGQLCGPW